MVQESADGITGGLDTTLTIAMTISGFTAIAWYNSIELNVLIWMTFKRYRGLYFCSILGASWGVAVYQLAFMAKFFQFWRNNYVSCAFITIGWYCMVTGQSLVLYSRLHLIMRDSRKLKWILYMIITDVFLFHIPTTVFTFGVGLFNLSIPLSFFAMYFTHEYPIRESLMFHQQANSDQATKYTPMYQVMEKVQMTAFCIQEFIISSVYLYETRRLLTPSENFQKERARRVMRHLIYVNVLLIFMDIAMLCTEYANLYEIQIALKGAVYSVKLRLEFAILNQLIGIASGGLHTAAGAASLTADSHTRRAARRASTTPIPRRGHPDSEELHLQTFDGSMIIGQNGKDVINMIQPPASAKKSYSAFVAVGAPTKSYVEYVGEGCVVKTTEVDVQGGSSSNIVAPDEDEGGVTMYHSGDREKLV